MADDTPSLTEFELNERLDDFDNQMSHTFHRLKKGELTQGAAIDHIKALQKAYKIDPATMLPVGMPAPKMPELPEGLGLKPRGEAKPPRTKTAKEALGEEAPTTQPPLAAPDSADRGVSQNPGPGKPPLMKDEYDAMVREAASAGLQGPELEALAQGLREDHDIIPATQHNARAVEAAHGEPGILHKLASVLDTPRGYAVLKSNEGQKTPDGKPVVTPDDWELARRGMAPSSDELLQRRGMKKTALSEMLPEAFTKPGEAYSPVGAAPDKNPLNPMNWRFQRGGALDLTNTGTLGAAEDLAHDPLTLLSMLIRPVQAATKAARLPLSMENLFLNGPKTLATNAAHAAATGVKLAADPITTALEEGAYPLYKKAFRPIDAKPIRKRGIDYRPEPASKIFFDNGSRGGYDQLERDLYEMLDGYTGRGEYQGLGKEEMQRLTSGKVGKTIIPDYSGPRATAEKFAGDEFTDAEGRKLGARLDRRAERAPFTVEELQDNQRTAGKVAGKGEKQGGSAYGVNPGFSPTKEVAADVYSAEGKALDGAVESAAGEDGKRVYKETNSKIAALTQAKEALAAARAAEEARIGGGMNLSAVDGGLLAAKPAVYVGKKAAQELWRNPAFFTHVGQFMKERGRESIWDSVARRFLEDNYQPDQNK